MSEIALFARQRGQTDSPKELRESCRAVPRAIVYTICDSSTPKMDCQFVFNVDFSSAAQGIRGRCIRTPDWCYCAFDPTVKGGSGVQQKLSGLCPLFCFQRSCRDGEPCWKAGVPPNRKRSAHRTAQAHRSRRRTGSGHHADSLLCMMDRAECASEESLSSAD